MNKLLLYSAAAFLLLAPLSVATGLSISEPAKYARLLTTLVMVALGALSRRGLKTGPVASIWGLFTLMFVTASLWSDLPHWALFYKGMFGLTFFSGIALVNSARTQEALIRGLRFLGMVSAMAACLALVVYLTDRSASSAGDRMALYGINANALGQTAAPLLILCLFLVLNDRSRRKRTMLALACCALGLIIIATGSRGSLLMALAGITFLVLPHSKRPERIAAVAGCVLVVTFAALQFLDLEGGHRIFDEMGKNTRAGIWNWGWKGFLGSPAIGIGWFHYGTQWAAVQSAYLQVLIETGLVGATILLCAMIVTARRWYGVQRKLVRLGLSQKLSYLSLAFLGSVLLHGAFESSLVFGSSLNALFLGMGTCLVDRTLALSSAAVSPAQRSRIPQRKLTPTPVLANKRRDPLIAPR